MEYIDFKIKREDDTFNCFENFIKGIANYEKTDYELMFVNAWQFGFNSANKNKDEKIGQRIYSYNETAFDDLKKYNGFSTEFIKTNTETVNQALNIIQSELKENRPVMIGINGYWMPWDQRYKKKVYPGDGEYKKGVRRLHHYLLATGINLSEEIIYCYERLTEKTEKLDFENYTNGCGPCVKYSIDKSNLELINWKETIYNACNNLFLKNTFEQMDNLALEIENLTDFQTELEGYEENHFANPILNSVYSVGRARRQFAISIEYLVEKYNATILEGVADQIIEFANQWYILKQLLNKLSFDTRNKSKMKYIAEKIRGIADEEEKLAMKIMKNLS